MKCLFRIMSKLYIPVSKHAALNAHECFLNIHDAERCKISFLIWILKIGIFCYFVMASEVTICLVCNALKQPSDIIWYVSCVLHYGDRLSPRFLLIFLLLLQCLFSFPIYYSFRLSSSAGTKITRDASKMKCSGGMEANSDQHHTTTRLSLASWLITQVPFHNFVHPKNNHACILELGV